jgi:hypothetical protein
MPFFVDKKKIGTLASKDFDEAPSHPNSTNLSKNFEKLFPCLIG